MAARLGAYVRKRLLALLDERRIVVWYDAEQAFSDLVGGLKAPNAVIVSAGESVLRARREAEAVYAGMNESENSAARANLLVYIPRARGTMQEERMKDPFEIFALAGTVFGDKEEDRLQSLARQAMPERIPEVDRLFAEGKPTLALLDGLEGGERYPVLQQALGTDSPAEIIALALCDEQKAGKLEKTEGCLEELLRMLEVEIGFKRPARVRAWDKIRQALGTYVLFSEFALDPPRPMPEAFSAVGRADETKSGRIFAACDRMRNDAALRDVYVELATRVEAELRMADQVPAGAETGQRDTFPFEERRYLARLIELVKTSGCDEARKIVVGRRLSVWKDRPERAILWAAVTRCLDFMEAAAKVEQSKPASVTNLKAMIEAYTAADNGWSDLDRCQRLVEQSAADCSEHDEIQPLLELCRRRYREVAPSVQSRYLELVRSEGWPPEGVLKQAQIFDKRVAPLLEEKQKVAFFLVDSLRFEMGRDLAETLGVLGEHDLTPAAVVPPTHTPWGMAALLPGADGALRLIEKDGELVPAMGTRLVRNVEERNAVLRERYGDRFVDVTLDDLLTKYSRLKSKLEQVDLVVVRTQDIDQIAESLGGYQARRALSEVIGDIAKAARRVVESGFTRLVFAADHGHIMLPEIPAGDVVTPPDGDWLMAKRRCRLGRSRSSAEGAMIFKATNVGITGDVEELCVPAGFKVFAAGDAYFHEGLSLQEAVVPVVVVRTKIGAAATDRAEVQIQYRSDKFTSRVIGLKLVYASLFPEPVRVRVEAYDGTGPKAVKVGEAADCDARDDASHEIVVQAGKETQVPVLLESDFSGGKIEIRVINPQNGMVWTRCELRNAMLD